MTLNPAGKWETIEGIRTYIATPTVDYPKNKAILYITDIFGVDLINHQVGLGSRTELQSK